MTLFRVQHTLQGVSALPTDRYVNTFYFQRFTEPDTAAIAELVSKFGLLHSTMMTVPPKRLSEYWSQPALASAGHRLKVYDLSDPEPRKPIYDTETSLPGMVATAGLPAEVCVCCSYEAPPTSGLPQARRRGRFFFGPLNTAASDSTGNVRPALALQQVLTQAVANMAAQTKLAGWTWVVFSPTNGLEVLSHPAVSRAWVDNAFDTQRRRGPRPTTRLDIIIP